MRPDDPIPNGVAARADAALTALLKASHLLEPDGLVETVRHAARTFGADDLTIYLADHDQIELLPLPGPGADGLEALDIDSTLPGRVFRTMARTEVITDDHRRLVVPIIDGTDRLGVMEVRLPLKAEASSEEWSALGALVAELLVAKSAYGDGLSMARRRKPMALPAEAQQLLLPPLTFMSQRLVVAGMLMPSYEVAGDSFDYACNGDSLHVALFDAKGHSFAATMIVTAAVSTYRNARRGGASLLECWNAVDAGIANHFGDEDFATALFAQLDLQSGVLWTISAGHPAALIVRDNRVIGRCADDPVLPAGLGLSGPQPTVTETHLEPGDRLLLFSDGIVEARSDRGEFFGEDRLVDQLGRALDTGLPAPEAVRRLIHNVVSHQGGTLRDDATLLLVEWRG